MAEDLRRKLTETAKLRASTEAEAEALNEQERELIRQAWREHIHPNEIVELTGRSLAHVRKLRPKDVPPLRMGGNAAPKKRRRK